MEPNPREEARDRSSAMAAVSPWSLMLEMVGLTTICGAAVAVGAAETDAPGVSPRATNTKEKI